MFYFCWGFFFYVWNVWFKLGNLQALASRYAEKDKQKRMFDLYVRSTVDFLKYVEQWFNNQTQNQNKNVDL